jgi:hypothetical protein
LARSDSITKALKVYNGAVTQLDSYQLGVIVIIVVLALLCLSSRTFTFFAWRNKQVADEKRKLKLAIRAQLAGTKQ